MRHSTTRTLVSSTAILASFAALAHGQVDITTPLPGDGLTGTVRTLYSVRESGVECGPLPVGSGVGCTHSPENRALGYAYANHYRQTLPRQGEPVLEHVLELSTSALAIGGDYEAHAELLLDITTTRGIEVQWQMRGPSAFEIIGPAISERIVTTDFYDLSTLRLVDPGHYQIRLAHSLQSGDWPGAILTDDPRARIEAFVVTIPEPSSVGLTAIALAALVFLARRHHFTVRL